MNTSPQHAAARRIILGFRPLLNADMSIVAATTLATAVKADVVGLFVQEDALIDLAKLPFTRALDISGSHSRRLTPELMKLEFDRASRVYQRALSTQAGKARVKWSFSLQRGSLHTIIKTVVASGDFIVVPGDESGFDTQLLVNVLRSAPRQTNNLVLVPWNRTFHEKGPVVALAEDVGRAESIVELAVKIARSTGTQLELLIVTTSAGVVDLITDHAVDVAGSHVGVTPHRLIPGMQESIATFIRNLSPSFVVADIQGTFVSDELAALALCRAARAPVVLLNSEPA